MTDSRRFQPVKQPFEHTYGSYHGAGVVAFVLSCADRWMAWRECRAPSGSKAQTVQISGRREMATAIPVNGADGELGSQAVGHLRQANAQSASHRLAMLLSTLPVVLAMAAALPSDAKAWNEIDVPTSKQSRLGRHLLAIDAYNLVRGHSRHLLFVDIRMAAELERFGVPHLLDANVTFLDYAPGYVHDEQRRDGDLVANANFVRSIGEQLAAKALAAESVILLICTDGTRSARAADMLADAGYSHVYTVIDGFEGDQVAADTYTGRRATNGWKLSRLPWSYPSEQRTFGSTEGRR